MQHIRIQNHKRAERKAKTVDDRPKTTEFTGMRMRIFFPIFRPFFMYMS